jgi:hypothetical protein
VLTLDPLSGVRFGFALHSTPSRPVIIIFTFTPTIHHRPPALLFKASLELSATIVLIQCWLQTAQQTQSSFGGSFARRD